MASERNRRGERRIPGPMPQRRSARTEAEGKQRQRDDSVPALPSCQERQTLEEVHVLLVLEQRAVQRRDELGRVLLAQRLGRHVLVQEQLQPVEKLRGRRLLLQA